MQKHTPERVDDHRGEHGHTEIDVHGLNVGDTWHDFIIGEEKEGNRKNDGDHVLQSFLFLLSSQILIRLIAWGRLHYRIISKPVKFSRFSISFLEDIGNVIGFNSH